MRSLVQFNENGAALFVDVPMTFRKKLPTRRIRAAA
jgi:hypothetical protein